MRARFNGRRPLTAILAAGALLLVALPVAGTHVLPRAVQGDRSCGPLTPGTIEFKVPLAQITGSELGTDPFRITLTHNVDPAGGPGTIDFRGATLPVSAAYIQGRTGGHLFSYAPTVSQDTGLAGPAGEMINNVSVCYIGGSPPPTDTMAPVTSDPRSAALWLVAVGGAFVAAGAALRVLQARARRRRATVPVRGIRYRG